MTTLFGENVIPKHQALYRKYRPNAFDGLIGQDHVKTTLANAIAHGTVSHAYLFTGPRGTGKTSTAKLFAKALNCEHPNGINPCGQCASCLEEGTDIIELDAASNNSVDDIRQLRENVILAPMNGKYKIYILDEVHMLTSQAFNAFLKTLEEPPAHAIFILATTEVHKLPATILSRCQRFDFRRISNNAIVDRLKYVLEQEGRVAEDTALNLIAQVSAGGMRDSLSLLDQALSRKENANHPVSLSDVLALTGAVDVRVIGQLIALIAEKKTEEALTHFNQCFESGKEPKFFIEELMIYLRDILVFKKLGANATLKKGYTDENFRAVAERVSVEKIYVYLEELQQTLSNSKFHHDLQLLMEMTIIRMINGEQASLQEQINELRAMIQNGVVAQPVALQQSPVVVNESPSQINESLMEIPSTELADLYVASTEPTQMEESEVVPSFDTAQQNVSMDVPSIEEFSINVPSFDTSQFESQVASFETSQIDLAPMDMSLFETAQVEVPSFENSLINAPEMEIETIESNSGVVPTFETSQVGNVLVPGQEIAQISEPTNDDVVVLDDPIGFMNLAIEANKNGIDWTTQIPSEVESTVQLVEPSTNILEEPLVIEPSIVEPPLEENPSIEMFVEPPVEDTMEPGVNEITPPTNVILSDKEQSVLNELRTATKPMKEEFNKVYESIINELANLNLSTKSIFREFRVGAVNENTVILVHTEKIKVMLIDKVGHKNKVKEAFENVYKPLAFIPITEAEWNTVISTFR
ncbi:DNA polymerase III subunit gamma/tau [Lysinibacillus composti]|uniref:DNA-directed DNA polymerase n=1 Tax=Lysinibacillus composti TaxID=720633 RepID=A0A3N9UJK0_9BACI|nr:DNA polymerase III subunit gamma/tau [Lysinibacillus composti]MBM7607270.1 DNA polymerase III subunit gamma/tau [Lysinibacillus composti]RQW76154.1 DNA polymerase III subunit gamma/tau [Lysinibacillus composti]